MKLNEFVCWYNEIWWVAQTENEEGRMPFSAAPAEKYENVGFFFRLIKWWRPLFCRTLGNSSIITQESCCNEFYLEHVEI